MQMTLMMKRSPFASTAHVCSGRFAAFARLERDVQVKQELEAGTGLKPPLLSKALTEVACFAKGTGMHTHLAPRLHPLCSFVSRAVNLSEHMLLQLVEQLSITGLLYTAHQLQALQQPEESPSQQVCNLSCCCNKAVYGSAVSLEPYL